MLPRLGGPVLFHEMLVTARRGRHVLFRSLYILVLLGVLFLLYREHVGRASVGMWGEWRVSPTQLNQVLRFAEAFFERFMLVQFAVIVLLTPGITAGAVAEEKDRKRLDFLLTTQLRGYEIVLGKLFSRIAYMALIVLAGLPVLSLLLLLGGIVPVLIVGGFAVSLLTLLSISCLSIFISVAAAKPRTAIFAAYLTVAAYFISSLLFQELSDPITLPPPVVWYCAGNPYLALNKLREAVAATGMLGPASTDVLWRYVLFHGFFALLFLTGSLLGLRVWHRWQASQGSHRAFVALRKPKRLPRVGSRPMFWKEVYAEPFLRVKRGGMILLTSLWFVCLVLGVILLGGMLYLHFYMRSEALDFYQSSIPEGLTSIVRRLTVVIGCLSALGAAIHAAGAFAGERDRQTMESLLATPLTNSVIIWGKWWGSFLSVRKAWYLLAAIWVVGAVTEVLSPYVIPVLLLACLVYTAFAASLGMWYSLVCRTSLRAMFWTLGMLVLAGGGHQLFTSLLRPLLEPPAATSRVTFHQLSKEMLSRTPFELVEDIQDQAFTPPKILNWLGSKGLKTEFGSDPPAVIWYPSGVMAPDREHEKLNVVLCGFGLACYAGMAGLLLLGIHRRFARATGRLPLLGMRRRICPPVLSS